MTVEFRVGDVFDRLAEIPDGSVDLVVTSPPFLALRSYLPADHPDKGKEIGSEATPAEFLDVMLRFTGELRRVLAPHGSIAIELGDTYANEGGKAKVVSKAFPWREKGWTDARGENGRRLNNGEGWPLNKSKALIPELYRIALAYGFNPLTGEPSPAGQWRIRNVVTWCRPNPPVGALGDKWRPATSDVVVACVSGKRYWDDLATRRPYQHPNHPQLGKSSHGGKEAPGEKDGNWHTFPTRQEHPSGAPLLDYWEIPLLEGEEPKPYGEKKERPDNRHERRDNKLNGREGDNDGFRNSPDNEAGAPLLDYWVIPPGGYAGSHYAVYPPELVVPLVKAMCPSKVCRTCGEPSRRIVDHERTFSDISGAGVSAANADLHPGRGPMGTTYEVRRDTLGFTDCGHDSWRPGLVLDPFAGSGTTLLVAQGHGHDAIGIDLDSRNAELALERVGPMFLEVG